MDFYNEFDPDAAQWTRNLIKQGLIPDGKVEERSITELGTFDVEGAGWRHFFSGIAVWAHALEQAGFPRDVDVWTGSCPCQPFSGAGKQKRFDDERHLWPVWFKLIEQCRPPVIFGEQVASALDWLDAVQHDLEGAGYAFSAFDISAAGIGAPHIRQRIYFVAVRLADYGGKGWGEIGPHLRRSLEGGRAPGLVKRLEHGGAVDPDRLGHADDTRLEGRGLRGSSGGELSVGSAGLGRFWANCHWVNCEGGKIRPVESGTFPLVDGAPARVVKLRAYGNAIVAPLAQAFIEEVMAVLCE